MGYHLKSFIAWRETAYKLRKSLTNARVVPLRFGIHLVLLSDELYDEICEMQSSPDVKPFWFLNERILDRMFRIVHGDLIGYIEADYFGGTGEQAAALWEQRRTLSPPMLSPGPGAINSILKHFGIKVVHRRDEFEEVGLDKHREMEDWLDEAV